MSSVDGLLTEREERHSSPTFRTGSPAANKMKVYVGTTGLNRSWQDGWPETTQCNKCHGEARIMFVAQENYPEDKGSFICDLHPNGGKGDFWLHDCCAVAVYLCKKCFEATALVNQA